MCFSASASFTAAGVLAPVGVVAVAMARRRDPARWLPLALTPLLFGAQQALEGMVWLGIESSVPLHDVRLIALAYLGFAFALWPIWMPWISLRLAGERAVLWQRRLMLLLLAVGGLLAALLWLPLLLNPELINPVVHRGSIDYQMQVPGFAPVNQRLVTLIYALIVCLPLLLTPIHRLRWLAGGLALAFTIAQLAFLYAFSSVWCYFSALLSLLVIWVLQGESPSVRPAL